MGHALHPKKAAGHTGGAGRTSLTQHTARSMRRQGQGMTRTEKTRTEKNRTGAAGTERTGDGSHHGKGRPRSFDRDWALGRALELFWQKGFEPVTVAELCESMNIRPPSLYAAFGNKTALFLEALEYYEHTYWAEPSRRFCEEPDVCRAVERFFEEAAHILLSPSTPCGCMVVLAAVNICPSETEIIARVREYREKTRQMFAERLHRAVADGQLPAGTSVAALSCALNTFLEGLSLQARDTLDLSELVQTAALAVRLLPARQQG